MNRQQPHHLRELVEALPSMSWARVESSRSTKKLWESQLIPMPSRLRCQGCMSLTRMEKKLALRGPRSIPSTRLLHRILPSRTRSKRALMGFPHLSSSSPLPCPPLAKSQSTLGSLNHLEQSVLPMRRGPSSLVISSGALRFLIGLGVVVRRVTRIRLVSTLTSRLRSREVEAMPVVVERLSILVEVLAWSSPTRSLSMMRGCPCLKVSPWSPTRATARCSHSVFRSSRHLQFMTHCLRLER
mmetsp:Transcript_25952/g.68063  ORF Transcript_25952/g.68063 Transcript_25952/m.68063 type:complete len:242 (+) Transcript_25952:561-1286(+)